MKKYFIPALALLLACCTEPANNDLLLNEADFDAVVDSKQVELVTLRRGDISAQFTNFGARVVSLIVPNKSGKLTDVVWGYPSIEAYINAGDQYSGPIVGRFGNRLGDAKFSIDGIEYKVDVNENDNHLHGGVEGFSTQIWAVESKCDTMVRMSYTALDGEMGYPGNLKLDVEYSLTEDCALVISYTATSDAPTVVNPTSHAYFNLNGDDSSILDHTLMIAADSFTPTNDKLIPTGEIRPVESTPLDFTQPTAIGARIEQEYEPLKFGSGYDHNFVFTEITESKPQAVLYSAVSGITMEVYTDQPAIQFYSGNFMNGNEIGKRGLHHNRRSGVALEAQNFPDAPNHENFPRSVLRPGETYRQVTKYKFLN